MLRLSHSARRPFFALVFFASIPALLTGCSASFSPSPDSTVQVGQIKGTVHGGQNPIQNADVYVLQASNAGYGAASQLGGFVQTDQYGNFTLTGEYSCTPNSQVYIYVEDGDPGLGYGNNSAIGLMAVLGTCPAAGTFAANIPSLVVNEVTTVAAAYSFAGFAVDALHVGSGPSALAQAGMASAFANAGNMVQLASGTAYSTTPAGNGIVPQQEINTLGDILASCVNSPGPSSSACTGLFGNATSDGTSGGTQPSDTATAAINIAHHPAQAPSTLYGLIQGTGEPFQPTLTSAPNDFTLTMYYSGGGLYGSTEIAIDGAGDAWVSNGGNSTVSEFSPLGVALSGSNGFTAGGLTIPYGIAIDTSGDAWVASLYGYAVVELSPAGAALSGPSGFTGNGDMSPYQIAIDTNGNAWTTNLFNSTVSEVSGTSGAEIANTTSTNAFTEFNAPTGVAVGPSNLIWVSDRGFDDVVVLNNDATYNSAASCADSCRFIALAAGGSTAWTSNYDSSITEVALGSSPTAFTGGGLSQSVTNVLDGAGNIWVANYNDAVAELNSAGTPVSPSTGYVTNLGMTYAVAVDPSGNVWVTDNTGSAVTLGEMIGAATPTVTPLVQAVINNNIAGTP